ncbi:MAG: hypothetical protein RL094_273 [Candidatus Parcubacteria bacterium]|jgi:ribose 5-phosphate isomerase B
MKIFIAADHAGFELKKFLIQHLTSAGHELIDCGAHELKDGDDYPLYISKAAKDVSLAEEAYIAGGLDARHAHDVRGIVIGGSGQGEAIVANKFPHVRAALYYGGPKEIITLSREHNDANILSLGARFLSSEEAFEAVTVWLETSFSHGARHERRIGEIDQYPDAGLFN